MPTYSKNKKIKQSSDSTIDVLVRLGMVEKMVDKLFNDVANNKVDTRELQNSCKVLAEALNSIQQQPREEADPWATPAAPLKEGERAPDDEVSRILDT